MSQKLKLQPIFTELLIINYGRYYEYGTLTRGEITSVIKTVPNFVNQCISGTNWISDFIEHRLFVFKIKWP